MFRKTTCNVSAAAVKMKRIAPKAPVIVGVYKWNNCGIKYVRIVVASLYQQSVQFIYILYIVYTRE